MQMDSLQNTTHNQPSSIIITQSCQPLPVDNEMQKDLLQNIAHTQPPLVPVTQLCQSSPIDNEMQEDSSTNTSKAQFSPTFITSLLDLGLFP